MAGPGRVHTAMTVAGSDSGGGAGIQADLKTFAALGVYGACAITAITAQNTMGVTAVHEVPPEVVVAQIEAVVADIGADAVKTGMLSSADIVAAVAEALERLLGRPALRRTLVVDPVMVAKSGDSLLRPDAVEALRSLLIPLAAVVTPNIPEAEALTGRGIQGRADARAAARDIVHGMGAAAVVVKGGHLEGAAATDLLYDGARFRTFSRPRVDTTSTHGTGCTFASAIAAYLARGREPAQAVAGAKAYVTAALLRAFPVGHGHGPLNHLYRLRGY